MTATRAALEVRIAAGASSVARACASAPQRWTLARTAADGWAEVAHQVVGDGFFAGDRVRTCITVRSGASLVVRGVAATPLRAGPASLAATRCEVEAGAALILLPGALVPHTGAEHSSALRLDCHPGGRLLAATVVVPGRTGMGERAGFARLSLRIRAYAGGTLALSEEVEVRPADMHGIAGMGDYGAAVSLAVLGDWLPADSALWAGSAEAGSAVAANILCSGGLAVRGLFPNLGAAQRFLARVEQAARAGIACESRTPRAALAQALPC